MEEIDDISLSLPLPVSLLGAALLLLLVIWAARKLRDPAATFVIAAIWLRYIVSTFHDFTYKSSPIGLSYNALTSLAVFAAGLVIIRRRDLKLKALVPIYLLLAIAALSGLVNQNPGGLVTVVTKFGYFIVVALCMYEALSRIGDRFMSYLLVAFAPMFVFQWISVVLNVPRSHSAQDGSDSFIGGYNHEAAFSVLVAAALMIVCLSKRMPLVLRVGTIVAGTAGLALADYRTTIVAFLPFLLVAAFTGPMHLFRPAQRALVGLGGAMLLLVGALAAQNAVSERFADLGAVTKIGDYLSRTPDQFDRQEQQLMSARLYLWSRYLDAWRNGPSHYRLIGAGPEARIPTKDRYPHNTFVSATYEYGLLGLGAYLLVFGTMFAVSLKAAAGDRARLVAAHFSFFILNMSTMPMWQIEGNILYALLCGYSLYASRAARVAAGEEEWRTDAAGTPRRSAA